MPAMNAEILMMIAFVACCGLAVATAGWATIRLAGDASGELRMRRRLRGEGTREEQPTAGTRFSNWLATIGRRITGVFADENGQKRHALRRKLIQAGIYASDAPRTLVAARLVLLIIGSGTASLVALAMSTDMFMTVAFGGIIGYFAPMFWLRTKIKANHKALERGLPDGLDLMVVCVEAGLTVDAAMQRVGDELALAHPVFARELSICHMETQIGLPRSQALRNLGDRTGFAPLQGLTAMLVQADRFGTSIAMALRVQAESLRAKRQHRAEEAAAKASVKLTFPLVLFIFPASFIVIAGPTVLKMMHSSVFN